MILPAPPGHHVADDRAAHVHGPGDIGLQDRADVIVLQHREQVVADDAGVVDQQVDALGAVEYLLDQCVAGFGVTRIDSLRGDLALRIGCHDFLGGGGILAIGEHHVHAGCGQDFHDGTTDPPAAAGDNGHLVLEAGIFDAWALHPEMQ